MQSWEETQTISLPIHTLLMGTLTTSEGASLGFGGPGLLNWQNLTVTASGGCVYGGALMAPERRNFASPSSAAAVCTAAGSFQKCSQFYHCHLTPHLNTATLSQDSGLVMTSLHAFCTGGKLRGRIIRRRPAVPRIMGIAASPLTLG